MYSWEQRVKQDFPINRRGTLLHPGYFIKSKGAMYYFINAHFGNKFL